MTRTDVMASSRPQTAGEAQMKRGSGALRGLVAVPIVMLLAVALLAPATAAAAEGTSNYGTTPTTPTTGTSPSKETTPTTSKETTPTTTSPTTEAAKTLPFTGFDLRWSFGIGLLLMAAGFSIVTVQRRRRIGEH